MAKSSRKTAREPEIDYAARTDAPFERLTISAQDGLQLSVSEYAPANAHHLPVICLPGLSRNARDFHELASFLSTRPKEPRRVVALDYRGRGYSGRDRDWNNYSLSNELSDLQDVLTALNIEHALFVGTSRGGILTMLLGSARPAAIRGVVLNDIGPEIDPQGLLRIRHYLREDLNPRDWNEAADMLRRMAEAKFPELDDEGWLVQARKIFREDNGRIRRDFDPDLVKPLDSLDLETAPPPIWQQFATLSNVPLLVLRGEHSDILSADTVKQMRDRHPDLQSATVPASGHAPLLVEPAVLKRIEEFVVSCG